MNICTTCGLDFDSVGSFDAHRVGEHDYLFPEGLRMKPPRLDGRRCLDEEEMVSLGFSRGRSGRWIQPAKNELASIARAAL